MTPIDASTQPQPSTSSERPRFRTTAREFANPVDYQHPHPSMAQFADWKPKTLRQALAATRLFFVDLLHHRDWTLFSQIRARDHDTLSCCMRTPRPTIVEATRRKSFVMLRTGEVFALLRSLSSRCESTVSNSQELASLPFDLHPECHSALKVLEKFLRLALPQTQAP